MAATDSIKVVTAHVVNVDVSSTLTSFVSNKRFQKDLTIAALKSKLELVSGVTAASMKLEVYNSDNQLLCVLDNEDALLGSYQVDDGNRIHVTDTSGGSVAGQFEDVSRVEKYEMSAEDYEKRGDSVRAYKERMKMGRFDPELQKQKEEEKRRKAEEEEQKLQGVKVGDRCEVRVPGQPTRRGTVQYTGRTEFADGLWVGVQYDEPLGKNDGSVKGKRYFTCPPKYGGFVSPLQVTIGDFPEEDIDMEDDEM